MSTILVVDDMAIFRDPIAMSLRAAGYAAVCAVNGKDALQMLKTARPDLVLLDLGMPVMDGLEFLRVMRADPDAARIPVICLTAQADRDRVVEVATFGVRDYLLKSRFSLNEMLTRIRKHLPSPAEPGDAPEPVPTQGAASLRPTAMSRAPSAPTTPAIARPSQPNVRPQASMAMPLTREQALQRVNSAAQTKTINGVAAKVMAAAAAPDSDLGDLAALIGRDPTLSARVLRAANSAMWGNNGGVIVTLPDAIRMVGFAAVRNLATSAAVLDMAPAAFPDGFSAGRWWSHTLAVAVMAERLASAQPMPCPAYLAGLCHDLAQLVLHDCFAAEYQFIAKAHRLTGKPLHELEQGMFEMPGAELLAHVVSRLGLPEAIRGPIDAFHHALRTRTLPVDPLARILWLAETYCNGVLLASTPSSLVRPFSRADCKQFLGTDSPAAPAADEFRGEILGLTLALARLNAEEEAEMIRPMLTRHAARVWLAREPSFSTFDPIEAALSCIADVTVSDRLPSVAEASGFKVLIISTATSAKGFMPDDLAPLSEAGVPLLWLTETIDLPVARTFRVQPELCPISLSSIEDFARAAV
jgi:HD-like signal output (HDOD) protein/DNA-binding NarL/FixJ family response regulator